MLKHFRVPGRLARKLEELGISVPVALRRAGLPRDLFDHPHCRQTCPYPDIFDW